MVHFWVHVVDKCVVDLFTEVQLVRLVSVLQCPCDPVDLRSRGDDIRGAVVEEQRIGYVLQLARIRVDAGKIDDVSAEFAGTAGRKQARPPPMQKPMTPNFPDTASSEGWLLFLSKNFIGSTLDYVLAAHGTSIEVHSWF
jgi:hypothetical protein